MEDRLLTLKELAAYLSVNERTVLKLAQDGTLPAVKVGNQWRFRKGTIDTWLDDQMPGVAPRHVEPAGPPAGPRGLLPLASCFEPGHVIPEVAGQTKTAVIVELAAHAHRLGLIRDATWFVGALVQREDVMPTALGNGLAFLHALRRRADQVVKPFMVLGRSRAGVDFEALDGRPAHLFFVLGLKYDGQHIPWLARLVQMLGPPDVVPALLDAPDAAAMYDRLVAADR